MLHVSRNNFVSILDNCKDVLYNNDVNHMLVSTFGEKFLDIIYADDDSKASLDIYKDVIMYCLNNTLDIHNENFEKNFNSIVDIISKDSDNILYCPFMVFISILDRTIKYLILEQPNNLQETVSITDNQLSRLIFNLNQYRLIPNSIVSKYVLSTSKDTLSYSKNFMNSDGNGSINNDTNSTINTTDDKLYNLVFDKDLNIYKFRDDPVQFCKTVTSFDKVAKLVMDDMDTISKSNSLNNFYVREYLRPCVELYLLKMDNIRRGICPKTDFFKVFDYTLTSFGRYNHEFNSLLLGIVLMINISSIEFNFMNIDWSDETNKNLSNKIRNNHETLLTSTPTNKRVDVGTLVKICKDTFNYLKDACSESKTDCEKDAPTKGIHDVFVYRFKEMLAISNHDVNNAEKLNVDSGRLNTDESQAITYLNESFEIKKDGTIKIVLKGRTSLMDEYADNHRLLKLNADSNDIESMKYNLIYALLIIESADRIVHSDKTSKTSKRFKDAEKAKSFANNDIATYLPRVKALDPKFDLNQFYNKVRADRYTIEVDGVETISGIKKLAQAVLV